MTRLPLMFDEIEAINKLDLLNQFILLTIIRFYLHRKSEDIKQDSSKLAFQLDSFHTYYEKFCSEYTELCEIRYETKTLALVLQKLVASGLLAGGFSSEKNIWEYSVILQTPNVKIGLKEAENLLDYRISKIPSDKHKQIVVHDYLPKIEEM